MAKPAANPKILLREILCATDFSAHSQSVLAHAAAIARRYRSKLYVVHIIPTDVYRSVPAEVMGEALKQTRGYVQNAMRNQLALEFLKGVPNEAVVREGSRRIHRKVLILAQCLDYGEWEGECLDLNPNRQNSASVLTTFRFLSVTDTVDSITRF